MGKVTLEYNLPEEEDNAIIALKSGELYGDIFHLKEKVRGKLKHGEYEKNGVEVAEEIYKEICDIVSFIEE